MGRLSRYFGNGWVVDISGMGRSSMIDISGMGGLSIFREWVGCYFGNGWVVYGNTSVRSDISGMGWFVLD